jgi:hypothetical protein
MFRNKSYRVLMLAMVVSLAIALPQAARAQDQGSFINTTVWSALHLTEPTEIPDGVLPAGDYIVKLARDAQSRTVVQIFSPDEKKLFATCLTRVADRVERATKAEFTFVPTGDTEARRALRNWKIPGSTLGQEFVYGPERERAFELAMAAQPRADVSQVPIVTAEAAAPVKEEQTTMGDLGLLTMPPAPAMTAQSTVKTLPRSASTTPALALSGLFLILLGVGGLRLAWLRSRAE